MIFRKAQECDIDKIEKIYSDIISCEEKGLATIGWIRGVYPTRKTAEAALSRGDLFVAAVDGVVVGSAIINKQQVDTYKQAKWRYDAPEDKIMVLHTLVILPGMSGKGYGKRFC